ncbi:MAG: hypothetical protein NWF01_09435 [Candidatus Bathyarchaeota archaeon]|nr:hypothetical protein [Candidatus Bathyarchaeota archaeon]
MQKRRAITKLQVILLIDIIVISLAAAAYLQLYPQFTQTTNTGDTIKPPAFEVSNLAITPAEIKLGESASLTATITNVGDVAGDYSIELKINDETVDNSTGNLNGGNSTTVELPVTGSEVGEYTVEFGGASGSFTILPADENPNARPAQISIRDLVVSPRESWPGKTVTVTVKLSNTGGSAGSYNLLVSVDGVVVQDKNYTILPGKSIPMPIQVSADTLGWHSVEVNGLKGGFDVVPEGKHTLSIHCYGQIGVAADITIDGVPYTTPVTQLFDAGPHLIVLPQTDPTGTYPFINWGDYAASSPTRTINLQDRMDLNAYYQGGSSCPSLYYWNGQENVYVAEISHGGWLGYIGYINHDGTTTFVGGNPWDHAKISSAELVPRQVNGSNYFDITLLQRWNEIIYLDAAYMLAVDHPVGTDAYASLANYMNPVYTDTIYTTDTYSIRHPLSAVNEKGQNVLSTIYALDGVFSPGTSGTESPAWNNLQWNRLTLDLGDLSEAEQIKLVINGIVDWGPAETYYEWLALFDEAVAQGIVPDGTPVTPPPYLEVMDATGNWVRVSSDAMPIPADYVARTFAVNLTGIFPEGITDYQLRINNFWNVTYDYIGVDISNQAPTTIQRINPIATLTSLYDTPSAASGNFTKLGDVTPLVLEADNMYVIGRQADQIELLFPADDLAPPAPGMVRDYFVFVADWFKDIDGNWGYGFPFTVDPLPFIGMSGFPYTTAESYPYDEAHLAYLREWNTRVINPP